MRQQPINERILGRPALQDPFEALKFEAPLEELKARLEKGEPVPWQGPSPWDGAGKTFVLYNCNYIYIYIYRNLSY